VGLRHAVDVPRAPLALLSIAIVAGVMTSAVVLSPDSGQAPGPPSHLETTQIIRSNVTFQEHGLGGGAPWSVTIHRSTFWTNFTRTTNASSLHLSLPLGNYTYRDNASGFVALPGNGTFVVNGTDLIEDVNFTQFAYRATFVERGLSSGTNWSVVLNDTAAFSTRDSLAFLVANGTYAFTSTLTGYTVAPANGSVVIDGANTSVNLTFTELRYAANFVETGLPFGSNWGVTLGGHSENSTGAAIAFTEPNGTYAFAIAAEAGWAASPTNGSITVNGAATRTTVAWTASTPAEYAVDFFENGLAPGTSWSVQLGSATNSSTGGTVSFLEPNGTYAYSIPSVGNWTPVPDSGQVTVSGSPVPVSFNFTGVEQFTVTFTATGLPSGLAWSVNLSGIGTVGTTTGLLDFSVPNGTYKYVVEPVPGWTASPTTGLVTVSGASPAPISIGWSSKNATVPVTFSESGLPVGTSWSVTLAGVLESTSVNATSGSITFEVRNGTYTYTVLPVSGWIPSRTGGGVTVSGTAITVARVTWTVAPVALYAVAFSETGLPAGVAWTVYLNGTPVVGSATLLIVQERNGTYGYTVSVPSGYAANLTSGTIRVQGAPVVVALTVHSTGSGSMPAGISRAESQEIALGVVLILAGLSAIVWILDRRRHPPSPPAGRP
jgi:hypothetical protein